jgi:hypothetical protein
MMNRIALTAVLFTGLCAGSAHAAYFAFAQETKVEAAKKRGSKQTLTSKGSDVAARKNSFSKQQQEDALAFARENHPELVPLVNQLKKTRRTDYLRALRELNSASTRFGRLKERLTPEKYERQLAVWKLDSRIRLQLAKWSVKNDSQIEADVKKSLTERNAIQQRQFEDELARVEERQARLKSLIQKLQSKSVDAEWERLSNSVARKNKTRKKAAEQKKAAREKQKAAKDARTKNKTDDKDGQ